MATEDSLTADWPEPARGSAARVSNVLVNEVPGVNRMIYDISSKPPSTIEWE